jgi:FMN phosphatase YigB (HAD superfamily)/DNA-binding XRE family transcriptional regulator
MNSSGGTVSSEQALGKHLQAARQAAGLTQQQLCHKAGLSYSTLTKIERGAIKSPSIFTIQGIAAALDVTLDALIGSALQQRKVPADSRGVSKNGVRFVYFDLNDCLVRFHTSGFTQLARDSGQPIDVVEAVYWKYDSQVCRGEVSLDELNTIWAERLGIMVDWKQYYLSAVDKMPGIAELVEWVHKRYRAGILSNTMPGFIDALQAQSLLPALPYDAIVDSSVVHALKPEVKIYETAAAMAGVAPSEILLIDDSRPNLIAAEQLGWHTIWFDSYQPEASIEGIRATLEPAA